ncbi:hypothetical protein H0H93_000196 [Arthromyces matolae]|nr:hypothetical protein H0H93_000196 [Arthromyces matolae]
MTSKEMFDIIFAGGGAVACVTAGRLAQANPDLKILILETGPLTRDMPDHIHPARYFRNLSLPTDTFTFHKSKSSPALAGRSVTVPTGRCLGGGSSVNFTMYTRAAASDYDDWETVHENPGWGSQYLIPLLKKAETFQPVGDYPTHGTSGPIKVSIGPETNVASQFLAVASQYDKGRKCVEDVNDFHSCNAYGFIPTRMLRYIDATTGRRSDTPHNYIYNHTEHTNLKIFERRRVVRVIFDNLRAVGVEHINDIGTHDYRIQEKSISYSSKLIVISAGTFGSPAILERHVWNRGFKSTCQEQHPTNCGSPRSRREFHWYISIIIFGGEDADTMDLIFRDIVARWTEDGQGPMAQKCAFILPVVARLTPLNSALDAGIKLRPNTEDLKEIGPDFAERWINYFRNAEDKPVMWLGTFAASVTGYPASKGRVHISAGLDPYGDLDFEPGYLNDPADVGVLRWAYKRGRELARRMSVYRGEFVHGHPDFPEGSKAVANPSAQPVEVSSPDILYTAEDDKAIDEYHRKTGQCHSDIFQLSDTNVFSPKVETSWHPMGTCAMKPREKGGVVDFRLNVYGVQNLKVADCSIAPSNVGANTYNTALGIGEKAAIIIADDLKLNKDV